jgi:hypothetical protein
MVNRRKELYIYPTSDELDCCSGKGLIVHGHWGVSAATDLLDTAIAFDIWHLYARSGHADQALPIGLA